MHILVVDDELLARQRLIKLIAGMEGYTVVAQAENGDKAIAAVDRFDPDLVLMDVKMPGRDGLSAAKEIAELDEPPAIVFCTAYDEFALDAFEAQAVGYIVKPVHQEQLQQVLEKAQRVNKVQKAALEDASASPKRQNISARTRKGVELIPIGDVSCLIADQKYVSVIHQGGETLIDETLKELEVDLAPDFVRVHRNALVACSQIAGLKRSDAGHYEVVLKDCDIRPMVSRRHLASVKALINAL